MKNFKAYSFRYIDSQEGCLKIENVHNQGIGEIYTSKEDIEKIKESFKKDGWEGDGKINMIWIPPFLYKHHDTYGFYIYHVKQLNNGISFLAVEDCYVDVFEELYHPTY